jgi:putative oxygen-independent coproporphyrinogen III oxidase
LFHVKQRADASYSSAAGKPNEEPDDFGFGLYVHWPFCEAKCPYCDFNSFVSRDVDHQRWAAAFEAEIARVGEATPGRELRSVFFGGGTPSLMRPETVDRVLSAAHRNWACAADIEVTLEANPSSAEASRFRNYASAGVNRFSIGVQALDDADLHRLGRLHTAQEAIQAIEIARETAERVSFDLIYARQNQSQEAWRSELSRALSFHPDHLSLYQLTIEKGTAFGRRHEAGKLPGLPDPDRSADLYEATTELCEAAGLPAYEVSNHARAGSESRHNLIYWRCGDYIGVGPGAHGRVTHSGSRRATRAISSPAAWLASVESGQGSHEMTSNLGAEEKAAEYLMMGLRLREGVTLARYRALAGQDLSEERLGGLLSDGLIWRTDDRFGTTFRGRMLLNAVLRELL